MIEPPEPSAVPLPETDNPPPGAGVYRLSPKYHQAFAELGSASTADPR